jgi:ABC-type transporter Mla MlaB component
MGPITKGTTPILKAALEKARHHGRAHLIIDLSAVTCFDLAGLSALLEARHRHTLNGINRPAIVAISNPQSPSDPYAVIGLQACFDIYDNLTTALHASVDKRTASSNE